MKVKHVKPTQEKRKKTYLQVIANFCGKIAVLEIYSEKKSKEFVSFLKSLLKICLQQQFIADT